MKPERWQQLDELFHAALERPPEKRAAFVDEVCAGDDTLRKQIEALLAAHEEAGSFIESPAMEVEARGVAADQESAQGGIAPGETVSHYRIIAPLGSGGMGEVYLAHDTVLSRQVALKLLPAHFTGDAEKLRRFEREARAASALNHPNIVTIYEIGHFDSVRYIATEYIDGVTLRERMGKPMKTSEALEVAIQVAAALAAAHAKGIVHRDIKPENIMVRGRSNTATKENLVKVLDFGIAKLTESDVFETDMPTRPLVNTSEGITMGTAPYMSPEQAQGSKVDARTDIWSLGVVLYEMITGRAPFQGPTRSHLIVSILEKEPPPLRTQSGEVPEALEWIVTKALRKDRDERYQTARELLSDLKDLKQRIDFQAGSERSQFVSDSRAIGAKSDQPALATVHEASTPAKLYRRGLVLAAAALITFTAIVLGLGYFGRNLLTSKSAAPFGSFKVTRLTSTGKASSAVISPDGKYVVHVMGPAEQQSLWLRHIATGSDKEIVPTNGSRISNLSFSPDGDHIYFVRGESGEIVLSQVPMLGGTAKKLVVDIDTAVTLSPDGKRFAFVRGDPPRNEASLIVANADGTGEEKLVTHPIDDFFTPAAASPAWSPDSETIAFGLRSPEAGRRYLDVTTVRLRDRVEKQLTRLKHAQIEAICWLPDGSGLVFTAIDEERSNAQIWFASYPAGDVRRITNDLNNYQNVSLTTDGKSLVTVQSEGTSNVWVATPGDPGRTSQITSSTILAGIGGVAWTPNGKIVYVSRASGNADIWIMNADGSENKQLTANSLLNVMPRVSPDGRYIVFASNRAGTMNIWRMDIDGANPKQLTKGLNDGFPLCTIDSKWIIFSSADAPKTSLSRVSIDGGNPVSLTNYAAMGLAVSPKDGKIAYRYVDEQAKPRRFRTAIISSDGGPPMGVFDLPEFFGSIGPGFFSQQIRWTADGKALTYIDTQGGVSNLWIQPVDGGPRKQITNFTSDLIFYYDWSADGKRLALTRGYKLSDVVLIRDATNPQ